MITKDKADIIALHHIEHIEKEMNEFGSALPGHKNNTLIILTDQIKEFDIGWIYCYDTKEYVKEGKNDAALTGNLPFIVSRNNGQVFESIILESIERFIEDFRKNLLKACECSS